MDSSEVGRFGTLCLMKRLEPDKVVAAYPIDDEEISFGRDPSCSIRLYYDAVSAVHCKIVFVDRKVRSTPLHSPCPTSSQRTVLPPTSTSTSLA